MFPDTNTAMSKKSGNPNLERRRNGKTPWGRGASQYRPGLFIKEFLLEHREGCVADMYRELSERIEQLNLSREAIGEKPIRRPNYSSFAKYFHWFKKMKLVRVTKRHEPAIYKFLKRRQFYELTNEGIDSVEAWKDPIRAAHPELRSVNKR